MQTAALEALEMRRGGADRDNVIGGFWKEKREICCENDANSNTACRYQVYPFPVEKQRCDWREMTRLLTSHFRMITSDNQSDLVTP